VETFVEIGENCFVQGIIPYENIQKSVFVHLGYGFHAEILLCDIPSFVERRKDILNRKAEKLENEIIVMKSDLNQVRIRIHLERYLKLSHYIFFLRRLIWYEC
jgi:prefoldin subunit 5